MRALMPVLILLISFLGACKENARPTASAPAAASKTVSLSKPTSSLDTVATNELMNMIHAYYDLKEAMVASSDADAVKSASRLMYAGESFKQSVASSPKNAELLPLTKTVIGKSDAISSSKQDSIEYKRARFAEISEAMFKIITAADLKHAGVYHAFCPMAFDSKGAYWLSAESEIRNPYFGKKMIECGEVRDSL